MQSRWKDAFLAYENIDDKEQHIRFVHFTAKVLQGNSVVYIAEADVAKKRNRCWTSFNGAGTFPPPAGT